MSNGAGPAGSHPGSGPFDRDELLARVGGDEELLQEVIELFLDEVPGQLSDIRESIASGSADTLGSAVHRLKGSLGNLAADDSYRAAKRLEEIARDEALGGAEVALGDLESSVASLQAELAVVKSDRAR
jgi:HPt (histidine-containing phosphotransfer) domain-containing protein